MAHIKTSDGIHNVVGALSKKRVQGVDHFTCTKNKGFKDPLTKEVVGYGPNEMFIQHYRNYETAPLTPAEKKQRSKWSDTCNSAPEIINNPSHPRYMPLYNAWRAQLDSKNPIKQFPNFVRHVLSQEDSCLCAVEEYTGVKKQ